jgi:hypothetical protein
MSGFKTIQFDSSNQSAFGTLEAQDQTPIVQADWVYGINTQLWNTAVVSGTGAAVDTDAARLRIQCGTSSTSYAYITSKNIAKYRAGQGMTLKITPIFGTGITNNIQAWGIGTIVSNALYDGYFFGFNGTTFGVAHAVRGSVTWTAQTSWNGDKVDGTAGTSFTYNPAYGTPCMIKYPYLGYGDIMFYIQNPTTGRWVLVHTIRYANTVATTQLSNPSLQIIGFTANSGNTTNKIMYSGSVGAFLSGMRVFTSSPRWSMDSIKTGITTETCLINIRNATTYNGVVNRGLIRLNSISVGASTAANQNAIIRFKTGVTIGGSPSYATVSGTTADSGVTITSGNSVASYDVAGTTVANGTYIFSIALTTGTNAPANQIIDLTPYNIYITPAEILTISAYGSGAAAIGLSVNWSEEI